MRPGSYRRKQPVLVCQPSPIAAGGIETTVENLVSGIVLPKHSPPEAYIRVVQYYLQKPKEYEALQRSTYARYLSSLNWHVLGDKLYSIMTDLVSG